LIDQSTQTLLKRRIRGVHTTEFKLINKELNSNGYGEFLVSKRQTPAGYKHKPVHYTRQPSKLNIESLLEENKCLIARLNTFSYIEPGNTTADFERYLAVQHELSKYNIRYPKYMLNTRPNTRPRFLYLLGNYCCVCGGQENLTFHHIIPKSVKFDNSIQNIRVLCRDCHDVVHSIMYKYKTEMI